MKNYLNYLDSVGGKVANSYNDRCLIEWKLSILYTQCTLRYLPTFILISNVCIDDAEYLDGLEQERRISSALVMEFLRLSCTIPSIIYYFLHYQKRYHWPISIVRLNHYSLYKRGACRCRLNDVSYKTILHHWKNYNGASASKLTKDIPYLLLFFILSCLS